MSIAATLAGFVPGSVKDVLEQLMLSVEAFWLDNRLPTRQAVGVTQRLLALQDRVDVLLARLRAGKVMWRRRVAPLVKAVAPAVPLDPAEAAAAADAAMQPAPPRKPVYGLPVHDGWLSAEMPAVAMTVGSDLEAAFQTEEMCALMRATPEVARRAGPVFRMLGLNEALLLVPEGYSGPGAPGNRKPHPLKHARRVSDYVPPFVVPEDYDEARDGRKPNPLRDPSWNYRAYVNYRSYLYYFMGRKPAHMRVA